MFQNIEAYSFELYNAKEYRIIHGRGGVNPKYPTQTLARLGASAKF